MALPLKAEIMQGVQEIVRGDGSNRQGYQPRHGIDASQSNTNTNTSNQRMNLDPAREINWNTQRRPDGVIRCYFCLKQGHIKTRCAVLRGFVERGEVFLDERGFIHVGDRNGESERIRINNISGITSTKLV